MFKALQSSVILFCGALLFVKYAGAELSPVALDFSLRTFEPEKKRNAARLHLGYGKATDIEDTHILDFRVGYQRAIDREFAIICSPLPLGILYSLSDEAGLASAVSWSLGHNVFDLASGLYPQFDSYSRAQISERWDFELQLEYGAQASFNSHPSTWSLGLASGTRYHWSSKWTVVSGLQLITQDAILRKTYLDKSGNEASEDQFALSTPITLGVDRRQESGSNLGFNYTFRGLGMNNSRIVHHFETYWHSSW